MRSIIYARPGDSSVLQLVERERPEPGAGELRVRVVVSGVNPTDWKSRSGVGSASATDAESVPNQDGSGIVDAVGEGVTGFATGDRVWLGISGWQRPASGTAQEYTITLPERVFPLPDNADFDLGAYSYVPFWDGHLERMDLRLRADSPQHVTVPGADLTLHLAAGDEIQVEISSKFRPAGIRAELDAAGFETVELFTDPAGDFGLTLARLR